MQRKLRLDQRPRVFAIDMAQESHHLLQRGNLTVDMLQLVPHRPAGVKQFESNAVVLSPSLQKHQDAQTATPYCVHFREVQNHDVGVGLRRNSVRSLRAVSVPTNLPEHSMMAISPTLSTCTLGI
jgi:hypothetical protein